MDNAWRHYSRPQQQQWVRKHQGAKEEHYSDRPEDRERNRTWAEAKQCGNNGEVPRRAGRQAPESQQRGIEAHAEPGMYDAARQTEHRVQEKHEGKPQEKQKERPGYDAAQWKEPSARQWEEEESHTGQAGRAEDSQGHGVWAELLSHH